jgi:hypothetical protein
MKDSDYFLLMASVFLAPHLPKRWGVFMWFLYMAAFVLFVYLERTT